MKKILIYLIVMLFFTSSTKIINAEENIVLSKKYLEENFVDNEVLVTLTEDESKKWVEYSNLSFPNIDCISVEDLTGFYNPNIYGVKRSSSTINGFKRILKLTIAKKDKNGVIKSINKLMKRPDVFYAGPNYFSNTYSSDENTINNRIEFKNSNINQWGNDAVLRDEAMEYISQYSVSNVLVGVVDNGVEEHIDLTNQINFSLSKSFVSSNAVDQLVDSGYGHGTLISGIISGINKNYNGILGVCTYADIVSLKHNATYNINQGIVTNISTLTSAISYAGANDIRILNLSLGFSVDDTTLKTAILNYPGLIICAAGNEGKNMDISGNELYPACFDFDNIITVGAINNLLEPWTQSNYGTNVDIFAPGVEKWSTSLNNTYDCVSATSYAAPFVTAVAAMLMSIENYTPYGNIPSKYIKEIIINSATKVNSLTMKCVSGGYLNAEAAIIESFNYRVSFEPYNLTHHIIIPKYTYSYLEEHEWSLLGFEYAINPNNPFPGLGQVCIKCGTNKI